MESQKKPKKLVFCKALWYGETGKGKYLYIPKNVIELLGWQFVNRVKMTVKPREKKIVLEKW